MKKVMYVDHWQFANIRKAILEDEIRGIDPGAHWARIFPGATELEFVVREPDEVGDSNEA